MSLSYLNFLFLIVFLIMGGLLLAFHIYKEINRKKNEGAYYLPCTNKHLEAIIEFLDGKKAGKLVDLGSGDGKIIIRLAKEGYKITGYEISPLLKFISQIKIVLSGQRSRAEVIRKNFWNEDLSEYSTVIFYGIDYMMEKLREKLRNELKEDSKIISIRFKFKNLEPTQSKNNVHLYLRDRI